MTVAHKEPKIDTVRAFSMGRHRVWLYVFLQNFVSATLLGVLTVTAWANGGGYRRGGIETSGTIQGFEPEGTENVRIRDEQLTIVLTPDEARVQVRYIMKNMGSRRTSVRFGFPVEELAAEMFMSEIPAKPDEKGKKRPELHYCRDYRVVVAGKPVEGVFESEPASSRSDPKFKGLKGWIVSKTPFDAGEEKTMEISYRADYSYDVAFVSDDGFSGEKVFKYRLSTGACWNGPIEHARVVVRTDGIDPHGVAVLKPVNRFHKSSAQWEWDFENLEPTLADDLVVRAAPEEHTYAGRLLSGDFSHSDEKEKPVTFVERDGKWYCWHSNYIVRASSTLPPDGDNRYDAANLKAYGMSWAEGAKGNGVGEWLDLTPDVPKPLTGIGIWPGHRGSALLFKANARPKRIEVLLNDEHRFEVSVKDVGEAQAFPVIDYEKPVKHLRLTIKEVYPGTTYEDLCISRVSLETRLNKKPKLRPSR